TINLRIEHIGDSRTVTTRLIRCFRIANSCGRSFLFYTTFLTLSTFLGMLAYKAKLYGRQFITINPRNTTQTCRDCGFVMGTNGTDKLTLDDRNWTCPNCGIHHIRDWNAAKNILDKGIAKLA
ncbi:transposase, partial [Limosilactobacillus fermentum]|uniref:transposase n=1 Tax=Limosilactobacillus fermentum TaxID=1613 RepID=UPI0021A48814